MKKLIWLVIFSMLFVACGKTEKPPVTVEKEPAVSYEKPAEELPMEEMEFFETSYEWVNSDGADEELRSIATDFVAAIFEEAYTNCRIESYTFSNAQQKEMMDEDVALDFELEFVYSPFTELSSQSALDPSETVNFNMRVCAEKEFGGYDFDSFRCYVTENDGKICPVFEKIPETDTYFGEIEFEDGKLELERMIWVREKGGYTNNGFFVADTDMEYSFDIAESCNVSYYKTNDFVDSMDIKEFMRKDNTENRLYYVTVDENNIVTDIVETYRP